MNAPATKWAPVRPTAPQQTMRMALTVTAKADAGLDLGDVIERAMLQVEMRQGHIDKGPHQFSEIVTGPGWNATVQYAWVEGGA